MVINTECQMTVNFITMYSYGPLLSIDKKPVASQAERPGGPWPPQYSSKKGKEKKRRKRRRKKKKEKGIKRKKEKK